MLGKSSAQRRRLRVLPGSFLLLGLLFAIPSQANAQEPTTRNEFWPEVDVYVNLTSKLRLFVLGTVSKSVEDGELLRGNTSEAQFGIHLDYIRNKHLTIRTGYRFGTSIGDDDQFKEHRLLSEQVLRKETRWGLAISDRNREDFRFLNGDFSFRYRNRVTVEREFQVRNRAFIPYASAEAFFDTRYNVWNKFRFAMGAQIELRPGPFSKIPLPKHQPILDIYYARQHDTRSDTPYVNAIGAALSFHF